MDALIIILAVLVLSTVKVRKEYEEPQSVSYSTESSVCTNTVLEIGTNLFLKHEPDAFEEILKEFNL